MANVQKCALLGINVSWCIRPWARCFQIKVQIPLWFPSCPIVGPHLSATILVEGLWLPLNGHYRDGVPTTWWCQQHHLIRTPQNPFSGFICFVGNVDSWALARFMWRHSWPWKGVEDYQVCMMLCTTTYMWGALTIQTSRHFHLWNGGSDPWVELVGYPVSINSPFMFPIELVKAWILLCVYDSPHVNRYTIFLTPCCSIVCILKAIIKFVQWM